MAPQVAGIAALLVVIVGGAWYFIASRKPSAVTTDQAARLSIVVMPFANLSGDPAQDYFAEGITENLTTALSQLRGSFVIARSTAMSFKGKNFDAKEIGKELGVRYVLEGSVQRAGQQVRVNAQLIDANKGDQLWADSFTDDLAELMKLQDDIVDRLARPLQIELVHAETQRGQREGTHNPDAIDLALRGWSLLFLTPTRENDIAGRELFEQALKMDQNLPDAVAGLADTDLRDHINGWTDPHVDVAARAMAEAERAIVLDPNYAEAYYIKADLLGYAMKPGDQVVGNEGLAAAEAALRNNPSFAPGYYASAIIEVNLGRYQQAISHLQQAIRLSPRDYNLGPWLMWMARGHFGLQQYDDAIQDALKSVDTGFRTFRPYLILAAAYAANGNDGDAQRAMESARRANPKLSVNWLRANLAVLVDWPPGMLAALRKSGLPED